MISWILEVGLWGTSKVVPMGLDLAWWGISALTAGAWHMVWRRAETREERELRLLREDMDAIRDDVRHIYDMHDPDHGFVVVRMGAQQADAPS